MGAYKYIQETFQNEFKGTKTKEIDYKSILRERLLEARRSPKAIERIEKPTNIARARSLGYKAKKGFIIARVKIRKGSGAHKRPVKARKPKRMGVNKLTRNESIQTIAEKRAARKFPNCEVLNSYKIGEDGQRHYFEVILVDKSRPEIKADKNINWILNVKGRAFRGLTSSARKSRGLRGKGKGFEKKRPSRQAHIKRRLSKQRK
jgi:large subunit ribosomal protein L15e